MFLSQESFRKFSTSMCNSDMQRYSVIFNGALVLNKKKVKANITLKAINFNLIFHSSLSVLHIKLVKKDYRSII